ncbi:MAG: Lrp/AsnC family transcriptional regulator [Thermoplasmata archaeon]|nr:Lrp/AsnC family transcriptional regulator [Thermoplasmata archaeon]
MGGIKFDDVDARILRILVEDAAMPVTKIAGKIGLPRTTVQERINRMREQGIIQRYTAIVNHRLLGRGTAAFVLVSFMPGVGFSQREVAEKIAKIPGVYEVHLIAGEWDILLKVRAATIEEIGKLIIDRIRAIPGVARTLTCTVFETVAENERGL